MRAQGGKKVVGEGGTEYVSARRNVTPKKCRTGVPIL